MVFVASVDTLQYVEKTALIANVAATLYMVGLIWMVQIVHYPLLAIVGTERASDVAREHQRRTGNVVGPPMLIEGLSTLALLVWRPDDVSWWLPWINGVFLAVALGCTIFLSVPLHDKMAKDPDSNVGHRLVVTNWPRTFAWSARGVLCLVMLTQAL
jgi:uncharacterized membrane protein